MADNGQPLAAAFRQIDNARPAKATARLVSSSCAHSAMSAQGMGLFRLAQQAKQPRP